jgi:hypothetical protein
MPIHQSCENSSVCLYRANLKRLPIEVIVSANRNMPSPSPAKGRGTERPLQNHVVIVRVAFVAAARFLGGHPFVLSRTKLTHNQVPGPMNPDRPLQNRPCLLHL